MTKTNEPLNPHASHDWYEFKIQVSAKLKDILTETLFEIGAEGVNESLSDPQLLQAYVPAALKTSVAEQLHHFVHQLQLKYPELPPVQIQILPVPDENWAETYKKYYVAQPLTELFFLRPRWDRTTPIPSHMIPIFMDPGQAFGTGLHPSTRLCLKTIESQILQNTQRDHMLCLDVGTGSGILALAAHHLGVKKVIAIDNDPTAVEVAQENILFNQVHEIDLSTTDIRNIPPSFDLVISNILLETHRELCSEYTRLVKEGGLLLLSGLLGHQKKQLFDFILPQGFIFLESRNHQEWACYLFVRRDPS